MQIKLYTPHEFQKPIHEACNDTETFFIVACAGRQTGKTTASEQQALLWTLDKKNMIVYWVSPTSSQSHKVYKHILELVVESPFVKSYKGSQGDTEIVFKNNSVIKFRSGAQENSLRGESIDYLILDEAAFIKETTYQEVLLPMLNVRGKKALFISTPKGKNWFYHIYNKGRSGDSDYKQFKFTSADNPYANKKIIEAARESMPDVLFRQEYLGDFVDDSAIIENIEELAILNQIEEPIKGEKYYIGVDIALKDDYNVVTIIDSKGDMIHMDRINHISAPVLKERLVAIFNKWKPSNIFIEENNQGLPIIQDLKQLHNIRNITGFMTTKTSKGEIINNLINAFASKKIKVLNEEVIKMELEMFTMKISSTGHVSFSAPSGFHDDIVMSLAIAYECYNKKSNSGRKSFYISR